VLRLLSHGFQPPSSVTFCEMCGMEVVEVARCQVPSLPVQKLFQPLDTTQRDYLDYLCGSKTPTRCQNCLCVNVPECPRHTAEGVAAPSPSFASPPRSSPALRVAPRLYHRVPLPGCQVHQAGTCLPSETPVPLRCDRP